MVQEEKHKPTKRPNVVIHPPLQSTVSAGSVITLLAIQKNKGERLLTSNFLSMGDSQYWIHFTKEILIRAFGPNPEYINSVIYEGKQKVYPGLESDKILEEERRNNLANTLRNIEILLEQLNEESSKSEFSDEDKIKDPEKSGKDPGEFSVEEEKVDLAISLEVTDMEINEKMENIKTTGGRKVFIIHGEDEEKAMTVADFITKLGLEPVIHDGQPPKEINLVDELAMNPDFVFAITLLTADDFGYAKGKPEELKPRPKQNVIFDLGYLVGRMKQNLVCALYEEGLDLPSYYQGRVFIPYDGNGLWKLLIARAMKLANADVDLNKAI